MPGKPFTALRGLILAACLSFTIPCLKAQSTVTVKFSVDMSLLINQGKFNPGADRVVVRGSFNGWGDQSTMNREGTTTVFSTTLSLNKNSYNDYKFYISTSGAADNGWEKAPGNGNNGNRTLNTGINPLVLPVVFFNDADMVLNLSSDHFNFYCTSQDINVLSAFSTKLESEYSRIVTSLQANITQKIDVRIYKNEVFYHNAMGYPEFPDWAVGSAVGKTKIQMASPNHAGSHTYTQMLQIIVHEFTHITEAWKTTVSLPNWLNEGVAGWFSGQKPARTEIVSYINSLGRKPELSYFETNAMTFGDIGGYPFSYTIAEFIVFSHGLDKLAAFVGSAAYSVLGYADKAAFQTAWHKHLNDYYINTPPPVITIGTIRRYGESWFINYSPHHGIDAENNTLIYYITITSDGFSKTYTDNNHTGSFVIARSEFSANTTYTVIGKSYDGIAYAFSATPKNFITTNIPPVPFSFTSPVNGQTISYNTDHQLRIAWSPVQGTDTDGDNVTDSIRIAGNGLNKIVAVTGANGFVFLDSTELKPGKTYTISGSRSDGFDRVESDTITFTAPGTDGTGNLSTLFDLQVYPVPANQSVTFLSNYYGSGTVTFEVYSITGKRMKRACKEMAGTFYFQLDISELPVGTYFVAIQFRKDSGSVYQETRKIIKQ